MGTFGRIFILNLVIQVAVASGKTVELLTPAALGTIKEEEILRVLSQNKSESSSENFTFVELIGSRTNHSQVARNDLWSATRHEVYKTNPHYGESNLISLLFL